MQVLLDRMLISNNIGWTDRNRWTTRAKPAPGVLEDTWQGPWLGAAHVGLGAEKRRHIVAIIDCKHMRIGACIWRSAVLEGMGCHCAVVEIGLLAALPATRGQEAEGHSDSEQDQTCGVHRAVNSNPKPFSQSALLGP
jgi:hypothetical protein